MGGPFDWTIIHSGHRFPNRTCVHFSAERLSNWSQALGRLLQIPHKPPITGKNVSIRRPLMIFLASAILACAGAAAVALNDPADWRPRALVGLLLMLSIASEMLSVEVRGLRLSGSFLSLVLAMALLGPAPAAAIGFASMLIDALVTRRSIDRALVNLATFATFPLVALESSTSLKKNVVFTAPPPRASACAPAGRHSPSCHDPESSRS